MVVGPVVAVSVVVVAGASFVTVGVLAVGVRGCRLGCGVVVWWCVEL